MHSGSETSWLLYRIAEATEESADASRATRREVKALRRDVKKLVDLAKQNSLLAALYGGAVGLHLTSDQLAAAIVEILKRLAGV